MKSPIICLRVYNHSPLSAALPKAQDLVIQTLKSLPKKKRSVSRLAVSFLGHQIKDFSAFPTHFTLHAPLPIQQAILSNPPGYKEPFHA